MVWATAKGIVGMLQDETTGPASTVSPAHGDEITILTGIVSANGGLHDGLHPLTDDCLLFRAEVVSLVVVVVDTETVAARIESFVYCHSVSMDVNVALQTGLLDIL